jgi:GntR family transcriptional regulator
MILSRKFTRYSAARESILEMLSSGKLGQDANSNKLPSEEELSGSLGVSTGTVREALRMLEMEGVVSKLHGSGNYFHRSTMELKMRIDLMTDYKDILEDAGYKVRREQGNYCFRMPDEREKSVFLLDEEILSFDLMYLADGKNAVFTRNIIPRQMLTVGLDVLKGNHNIMELLWRHCKEKIANSIEKIVPRTADDFEVELFGLSEKLSIIAVDEVFYSFRDHPIGYATVFFNPEIMKMSFLRKW